MVWKVFHWYSPFVIKFILLYLCILCLYLFRNISHSNLIRNKKSNSRKDYKYSMNYFILVLVYIYLLVILGNVQSKFQQQQNHPQMSFPSLLVKGFFKQIQSYTAKRYFSAPNIIQSSVGLIFKLPQHCKIQNKDQFQKLIDESTSQSTNKKLQKAEILFVQRAGYVTDKNAFNVVFPGGQCDEYQSDLTACQRQLKEQIDIDVHKQCLYIGQLPSNFYYLKKRGKQVYISCHIYLLRSSQNTWVPKLNPQQLRQHKWVNIQSMLSSQNYLARNQIKLGVFERMPKLASYIAKKNITNISMPELNLGMDRNLWGLTLWIWSYVLQMALNYQYQAIQKQQIQPVLSLIQRMKGFKLSFKPYSIFRYPAQMFASSWHYWYRVKPFSYPKLENRKKRQSVSVETILAFSLYTVMILVFLVKTISFL